jgi:hypothetical protein
MGKRVKWIPNSRMITNATSMPVRRADKGRRARRQFNHATGKEKQAMTIQQEFKSAATIAASRIRKAHPGVSLDKLINRLSYPERMVMQNEIARVYADLVDQALQHVDPTQESQS